MLNSRPGQGTTFRIIMPKAAKGGSMPTRQTARRQDRYMAEQDDVLHLIDDSGAAPEVSAAQMEDRGDRRRSGGARRHALCAERLQPQRPGARNPVGLFGGGGPRPDARASRHRGRAARRHHGDRRTPASISSNTSATSSRTRPSASSCAPASPDRRPSAASSSSTTSTTTRRRPSSPPTSCSPR